MTSDGTGRNGVNYSSVSNWLTWNDSDVSLRTVSIPTLEDHVVEGTKTFNVILTNAQVANNGSGAPTNALALIPPSSAVVSIADDDSYGQLNFSADQHQCPAKRRPGDGDGGSQRRDGGNPFG